MKNAQWSTLSVVLIIVLLAAIAPSASSQGTVNVSIDELQLDGFPRVQALTTVTDANGVPILGMGADKFEIVEDGRTSFPPDEVSTRVNRDVAISIVMVIDISGSMEGKPIEGAIAAANALLDQLSEQDRAAIIAFADEVQSLDPAMLEEGKELGFTADKNAVRNVVNFLDGKLGWDTPLYDAIYKGVKMAAGEPIGKRAVVVMTDGRDERDNAQGVPVKDKGSVSTADDPINEANRHNIPIFAVGLGSKLDARYLTRLGERTGGVYRQAPQPEELVPLFEQVVSQLKTQYALGYNSHLSEADAGAHSVLIRVNLPQGQDFDEFKFQIGEEPAPAAPVVPTAESGGGVAEAGDGNDEEAAAPADNSAETESLSAGGGLQGIVDDVREIIEEQPVLAIVVAAGVLLLLILLIALAVVLSRGRKGVEDEYAAIDFGQTDINVGYGQGADWAPDEPGGLSQGAATSPGAQTEGWPASDRTEAAPSGWGAGAPPFVPGAGQGVSAPAAPPPRAPDIPAAGGTRVIERGPKHVAILVSRLDPNVRHDLAGTVNVGRAHENQLVLQDATVSRHHAWIKAEGERFLLFDVGSANGTFVNDEKVEEPRELESGDKVRFGDVEFVFNRLF